eukprot:PLAT4232.1.p2 GENE.PLAT4232.1~~PLAT4232.1.p2  ORF type:complete len:134 (-),score=44.81 PLAT4232.1:237-638(-)
MMKALKKMAGDEEPVPRPEDACLLFRRSLPPELQLDPSAGSIRSLKTVFHQDNHLAKQDKMMLALRRKIIAAGGNAGVELSSDFASDKNVSAVAAVITLPGFPSPEELQAATGITCDAEIDPADGGGGSGGKK